MQSFYGGPAGQSFKIKKIFTSYYGEDGLKEDLSKGWSSPITVGEYVMISYGDPAEVEVYQKNLDADQGENFNSSLWQKVYEEELLNYKFITSCVGTPPNIEVAETIAIGPNEAPKVENVGTKLAPVFQFSLPKAMAFYYGELLGERIAGTYTLTDESFIEYKIGDCYVNSKTGFIYKITEKTNNTTCVFEYQACLLGDPPNAETALIAPYTLVDGGYVTANPQVERILTNEDETEWKLVFKLPRAAAAAVTSSLVGPLEESEVTSSITDENTITYAFKIPRGSRIYSGTDTSLSTDASNGDVYINTATGIVYTLINDVWEPADSSIKGPTGQALNIVKAYSLSETDSYSNTLENGVSYIEANYTDEITSDKLFSITWNLIDGENISYWYFKSEDGTWSRVQLTSSTYDLIKDVYAEGITDKAYSIRYVNEIVNSKQDTLEEGTEGQVLVYNATDKKWQPGDAPASGPQNIVDGSATGSVRMANASTTIGENAFAEGYGTTASGMTSHAEGATAIASGQSSHAEGTATTASNYSSHAEGYMSTASGWLSHAEGEAAVANHKHQHVQGAYNIEDDSVNNSNSRGNYAHIVGNGTSYSAKSNAHTLDWNGNAWFAGDVYVGSTSGTNKDDGSVKLMKDVSATDGQIMTYDGTDNKWVGKDIEKDIFVATIPLEGGEIAGTTFEELKTAYDAGKILFARPSSELSADDYYIDYILPLGYVDSDDNGEPITFGFTGIDYIGGNTVSIIEWYCTAAGWRDGGARTIAVSSNHDTATAGQVLTKTDSGSEWSDINSDVFIATYGTTTYNEIKAAYDAGKVLFVKSGNVIAPYISFSSSFFYFGILTQSGVFSYYYMDGSDWYSASATFAKKSDIPSLSSYVTYGSLKDYLNRDNQVSASNTNYTNYQARGEALFSDSTTPSAYGTIAWQYS